MNRSGLLGIGLALAAGCAPVDDTSDSPDEADQGISAPSEHVVVDLETTVDSAPEPSPATRAGAGFLCGFDGNQPTAGDVVHDSASVVSFVRGDRGGTCGLDYGRLHSDVRAFERILSDGWDDDATSVCYTHRRESPGNAWRSYVRGEVRAAPSPGVSYDVWNEPDGPCFWRNTESAYHQMWQQAVEEIRGVEPHAVVVGPSTAHFNAPFIQRFLQFARDSHTLPDVISWHELGHDENGPAQIVEHVNQLHEMLARLGISERPVQINEYMDGPDHGDRTHLNSPGRLVYYLANLERARVQYAAHSCWSDSDGTNTCASGTMAGVLTRYGRPRSTWWAYERYAHIGGQLHAVDFSPHIDGVAGSDGHSIRILLGNHDSHQNVPLHLEVRGVASAHVDVAVDRIRNTGEHVLGGPTRILQRTHVDVTAGTVTIDVPGVGSNGVWSIELTGV